MRCEKHRCSWVGDRCGMCELVKSYESNHRPTSYGTGVTGGPFDAKKAEKPKLTVEQVHAELQYELARLESLPQDTERFASYLTGLGTAIDQKEFVAAAAHMRAMQAVIHELEESVNAVEEIVTERNCRIVELEGAPSTDENGCCSLCGSDNNGARMRALAEENARLAAQLQEQVECTARWRGDAIAHPILVSQVLAERDDARAEANSNQRSHDSACQLRDEARSERDAALRKVAELEAELAQERALWSSNIERLNQRVEARLERNDARVAEQDASLATVTEDRRVQRVRAADAEIALQEAQTEFTMLRELEASARRVWPHMLPAGVIAALNSLDELRAKVGT